MGVAGVSFGAVVALDFFNKHRGQAALAVVSPTVAAMKRARLDKLKGGKLLVAGEMDRMAPADELISLAVSSQGVECRMISGADHTLGQPGERARPPDGGVLHHRASVSFSDSPLRHSGGSRNPVTESANTLRCSFTSESARLRLSPE